jgi:hypothetical protein
VATWLTALPQEIADHVLTRPLGVPHCGFQNRERANRLRSQPTVMEPRMPGNRNILYLIIGALIVAVGVLGYNLYQTKKQPEGLQINVGPNGLKIQNK